jgi:hypothetical protein
VIDTRAQRPVGTTDVLKFVGVAALLVDHYGLFFAPDEIWWRVAGRIAAPVFFFLIGYARPHPVPRRWIVLGVALTALDAFTSYDGEEFDDVSINILLNFALLRFAVLPFVERHILRRPLALSLFAAACVLAMHPSSLVLEYGTEGWLFALFGLAQRAVQDGETALSPSRTALALVAPVAYAWREIRDFALDGPQAAVLAGLLLALTASLLAFRRLPLPAQPPEPAAALLRFCGRHSLEIYAVTLFAMQFLAYAIGEPS